MFTLMTCLLVMPVTCFAQASRVEYANGHARRFGPYEASAAATPAGACPVGTAPHPQRRRCNRCSVTAERAGAISVTWRRTTPADTAASSPVSHPEQQPGTWSTISSGLSTRRSETLAHQAASPAYGLSCAATNAAAGSAPDHPTMAVSTSSGSSEPATASARRSPPPTHPGAQSATRSPWPAQKPARATPRARHPIQT